MTDIEDEKRFLANRQKEIDGAALYRVLAESEAQPQMAALYQKFAAAEERHASAWESEIEGSQGIHPPTPAQLARPGDDMARPAFRSAVCPAYCHGLERADSQAYRRPA